MRYKISILIVLLLNLSFTGVVQGALPDWNRPLGGRGDDFPVSMKHTSDRGYIIAGTTTSYGAGDSDIWLIKTDAKGSNLLWDKPLGGEGDDSAGSVIQVSDNRYIIAGTTTSYSAGGSDIWLVKIDTNGNRLWDKPFGGPGDDTAASVVETSDGGYIITGTTSSYSAGGSDIWLIKTDANGNRLWDKPFGGPGDDKAASVVETSDHGYIITGTTSSYSAGGSDIWLIKTDAKGNRLWDKPFGGKDNESAVAIEHTSDGGYIITGTTSSYSAGGSDIWLVKTDANGSRIWDRPFGGPGDETAASVVDTSDGGYIITGTTSSYSAGGSDIWLIKTDANGNRLWDKPFGGPGDDTAASVVETSDHGYIITGTTSSYSAGGSDIWLIKTDAKGNRLWDKPFGGKDNESAVAIEHTSDGGYIIAGTTSSYSAGGSDIWLVKTDANGNRLWDKPFGGPGDDTAASVVETSDDGYIIAGTTSSYNAGGSDVWILYVKDELSSTRKSSKAPSDLISNIYRQYASVILAAIILFATIYVIIKLKR